MAGAVNLWAQGYYRPAVGAPKVYFGDAPSMLCPIDGPFPMVDVAQVYARDIGVLMNTDPWPVLGIEVWLGDGSNQSPVSPVGDGVYGVQLRVRDSGQAGGAIWTDTSAQLTRSTVADFEVGGVVSDNVSFHRLEVDRLVLDHASGSVSGVTGGTMDGPVARVDGRNVAANQRKARAKRRGKSPWGKGHWQG